MLPPFLTRHDLFRPEFYGRDWISILGTLAIDWPGKILFLVGMALHSVRLLLLLLAGMLLGALVGFAFLGWYGALNASFVLYAATPAFIALAGIFTVRGLRSFVFATGGVVLTFLVWFHLGLALTDSGLPVLTLPMTLVVIALLFMLRVVARMRLPFLPEPVPLIRAGSLDGAKKWSVERDLGWRYWRALASKNGSAGAGAVPLSAIDRARALIAKSHRIVVMSGAGISTESGIPDYRTGAIAWKEYDTSHFRWERFISSEESRRRYWEMSQDFYLVIRTAEPNAGHRVIADLDRRGKLLAIVTQNVDRLHQRAGVDPERVIELHGNEHRVSCLNCGRSFSRDEIYHWILNGVPVPHCSACQGILKPDSVAFGQPMPEGPSRMALDAVRNADLLMIVGTSLTVQPAASLPLAALRSGTPLLIVNLHSTDYDLFAAAVLRGAAAQVLPKLLS
jgi:NAD-dependent deacetylase